MPDHDGAPVAAHTATILVVLELSKSKWKVGVLLPGTQKLSRHTIDGGDLGALQALLDKAKGQVAGPVRVICAFEAGFDGVWLYRWLNDQGAEGRVLDSASIQVNRRKRRAKTDNIDLDQLMRVLAALERGESKVCSVVRPPSVEDEDARRISRERERLVRERVGHSNRIKGLLFGQGVRDLEPVKKDFLEQLAKARTGDGRALPPNLLAEIRREHVRLGLVVQQIAELAQAAQAAEAHAEAGSTAAKVAQLVELKGLGEVSARPLVHEVFWRSFNNRREVGAYFGLDGTPYDSGDSRKELGISKAGNPRARALAIELAWLWLRHQPDSDLSRWFAKRVGTARGKVRKIAIVALARKLMIALWRYLEIGLVPTGAKLRSAGG